MWRLCFRNSLYNIFESGHFPRKVTKRRLTGILGNRLPHTRLHILCLDCSFTVNIVLYRAFPTGYASTNHFLIGLEAYRSIMSSRTVTNTRH